MAVDGLLVDLRQATSALAGLAFDSFASDLGADEVDRQPATAQSPASIHPVNDSILPVGRSRMV
jgi:hypothetical protein